MTSTLDTTLNIPSSPDGVVFSSQRLWFCRPSATRDQDILNLFNDEATMLPWLPMLCPMNEEDMHTRRELHRAQFQKQSFFLDVVEKGSGNTIGTAGFRSIKASDNTTTTTTTTTSNASAENNAKALQEAEWGIVISKDYQRMGYCTEAFAANVEYIADQVQTVTASTLPHNTRMMSFFRDKIGMEVYREVEHYGLKWTVFGRPNNVPTLLTNNKHSCQRTTNTK